MVKKTNLLYLYMVLLSCASLPVRAAIQVAVAQPSIVVSSNASLSSGPSSQNTPFSHGTSPQPFTFPPPPPPKPIDNTGFREEFLGQDDKSTIFSNFPGKKIIDMAKGKHHHVVVVPKHLDKVGKSSKLPQRQLFPTPNCSSLSLHSSTPRPNSTFSNNEKLNILAQFQMMLEKNNEMFNRRSKQFDEDSKQFKLEINNLKNDMKLRVEDIKQLTKKVEQGEEKITELKIENGHLRNIVDDLNIQVNKITKERDEYKKERDEYKKKWKYEKDKAERLQSQLAENPDFLNEGPENFLNIRVPIKYILGGTVVAAAGTSAVIATQAYAASGSSKK